MVAISIYQSVLNVRVYRDVASQLNLIVWEAISRVALNILILIVWINVELHPT